MRGLWRTRGTDLHPLCNLCLKMLIELRASGNAVKLDRIPRQLNAEADSIANTVRDEEQHLQWRSSQEHVRDLLIYCDGSSNLWHGTKNEAEYLGLLLSLIYISYCVTQCALPQACTCGKRKLLTLFGSILILLPWTETHANLVVRLPIFWVVQ